VIRLFFSPKFTTLKLRTHVYFFEPYPSG
jgi:hypothetical protein